MSKTPINKLPLIIISAILLGAILPMTVRGNSDAVTPAASGDSLSYNDRRRYDYFFIEAIRKQNAGDYAAAFDLLNHCLEIKPDAAEAYYARASYFSEMQNDSLAQKAVRDLIAISKAVENPHAADTKDPESMDEKELKKLAKELEKKMRQAAAELNFEEAASLRDRMIEVKKMLLDME